MATSINAKMESMHISKFQIRSNAMAVINWTYIYIFQSAWGLLVTTHDVLQQLIRSKFFNLYNWIYFCIPLRE